MGLEGDDYVMDEAPALLPGPFAAVLTDLTYDEAHAFIVAFGAMLLAVHLELWMPVILGSLAATGLGKAMPTLVRPQKKLRRILMGEPWYWWAGVILGAPAGIGLTIALKAVA